MIVSAGMASRYFRRVARKIPQQIRRAERVNLLNAKAEAQSWSMGSYSAVQLAIMGHPYARSHWNPPQDEAIINFQEGLFAAAWVTRGPVYSNGDFVSKLKNLAPYSGYMRGTHLMGRRPIDDRVADMTAKSRYAALDRALEIALIG